jgi:hypothetical protein
MKIDVKKVLNQILEGVEDVRAEAYDNGLDEVKDYKAIIMKQGLLYSTIEASVSRRTVMDLDSLIGDIMRVYKTYYYRCGLLDGFILSNGSNVLLENDNCDIKKA